MAEPAINTDLSDRIAEIRKEEGRGPACEGGIHTLDQDRRCVRCGRLVEERPDDGLFFSAADAWDIAFEAKTAAVERYFLALDVAYGPDKTVKYLCDENGNIVDIINVTPAPSGEMG